MSEHELRTCISTVGTAYSWGNPDQRQRVVDELLDAIRSPGPNPWPMPPDPDPDPSGPELALSQWGITWVVNGTTETPLFGRFISGDWWVVGPVTLSQVTPSGAEHSGSQVNPDVGRWGGQVQGSIQGFDRFAYGTSMAPKDWDPSLNVAARLPITLNPGDSLVSTISRAPGIYRPRFETAAVLTVLDAPPPADAFRPPYSAGEKPLYTLSQVDWSFLQNIPKPPNADAMRFRAVAAVDGVWLRHGPFYLSRELGPWEHMSLDGAKYPYSADMTATYGDASLLLHYDFTQKQKEELGIHLIQRGIDFAGIAKRALSAAPPTGNPDGLFFDGYARARLTYPGAGQSSGYKWPILLASRFLQDNSLAQLTRMALDAQGRWDGTGILWGEDGQTFTVIDTPAGVNFGHGNYSPSDVGLPEWGSAHAIPHRTNRDNRDWFADPYRISATLSAWWGQLVAAELAGLRGPWAHEPLWNYAERYRAWLASTGAVMGAPEAFRSPLFGRLSLDAWDALRATS